jgi:diguanylate cyclase (GGDEF)-like protein
MYHPDEICDPLIDPFTGLYNRHGFRLRLAEYYARAKELRLPLAVLAIDLDRFADVNARFFVLGGDIVIAEVARLISASARVSNIVARDGGDQFSLVLQDTNCESACLQAERIRQAIELNPIELRKESASVTASIGVASATFDEPDPWDLFLRARTAVQRAKELGRNQVAVG